MWNLTVVLSIALVTPTFAASVKVESLRDLKSLEVGIEALPSKASDLGITKEKLQVDVELRIRKANVHVKPLLEGDAGLFVSVNLMQIGSADKRRVGIALPNEQAQRRRRLAAGNQRRQEQAGESGTPHGIGSQATTPSLARLLVTTAANADWSTPSPSSNCPSVIASGMRIRITLL